MFQPESEVFTNMVQKTIVAIVRMIAFNEKKLLLVSEFETDFVDVFFADMLMVLQGAMQ